jgi:cell pole-organizing protein PopZ
MSDTNQEPTMEEILASIRRIISEDDAPQAEGGSAGEPVAEAAAEPDRPAEPNTADDEVLDLTDRVEQPAEAAPMETVGDLDVFPREEPAFAPAPEPEYSPPPPAAAEPPAPAPAAAPSWTASSDDEGLVSRSSAETAAASFASLSQSLMMPQEGRSLEDIVREMMKPMLKDWLDQNLPAIVQRTVQEEVERIARARVR